MAIFGDVLRPVFQRPACSTFQTCILNSHQGHTTCENMVDIRSATAEIRRGKKKKNKDRRNNRMKKIMACRIP